MAVGYDKYFVAKDFAVSGSFVPSEAILGISSMEFYETMLHVSQISSSLNPNFFHNVAIDAPSPGRQTVMGKATVTKRAPLEKKTASIQDTATAVISPEEYGVDIQYDTNYDRTASPIDILFQRIQSAKMGIQRDIGSAIIDMLNKHTFPTDDTIVGTALDFNMKRVAIIQGYMMEKGFNSAILICSVEQLSKLQGDTTLVTNFIGDGINNASSPIISDLRVGLSATRMVQIGNLLIYGYPSKFDAGAIKIADSGANATAYLIGSFSPVMNNLTGVYNGISVRMSPIQVSESTRGIVNERRVFVNFGCAVPPNGCAAKISLAK